MNAFRAGLSLYVALARGELRLAFKGAPSIARRTLVILAWGLTAIVAGSLVGFIATTLPPMATAGYIGVFALVLLWVAPDLPVVSEIWLKRLFFAALVVFLCVPMYYAVVVSSLPWISARRLVTFALVTACAIAFATSSDARRRVADLTKANRLVAACVFGFPIAAFLSIFTSIGPLQSFSSVVSMLIELYIPFLTALYVIRTEDDVGSVLTIILFCALFNSAIGVMDFVLHKSVMVSLLPKSLRASLAANNLSFGWLISNVQVTRNGIVRVSSVFNTALNFAEFEAMVAPIALVFFMHARRVRDVVLGIVTLVACLVGIFVSGSRGGFVSVIVALGLLSILWVIRSADPRSLKSAVAAVSAAAGIALVIFAVLFVGQVHKRVLGGGADQSSTDSRNIEWQLAKPQILANPVTGHGFGHAGVIIGYYPSGDAPSVDSTVLSTLAETGVLGLVSFFGIFLASIKGGFKHYVTYLSWGGAMMGGLAASLTGYTTYRLVLTVNENGLFAYVLVACVMVLSFDFLRRGTSKSTESGSDALRARWTNP
jgi:O-antigen ligase